MCLGTTEEGEVCLKAIPERLARGLPKPDTASIESVNDEIEDPADEAFSPAIPSQIETVHPIPGGIDNRPLSLQEAAAFVVEVPQDPRLQEEIFLRFLCKAGPDYEATMPPVCQIPHFAIQGYMAARRLVEVSNEFYQKSNQLGLQLQENLEEVSKVSQASNQISKPVKCDIKEKNVWKVLESLTKEVQTLKDKESKAASLLFSANNRIKELEGESSEMEKKFDKELNEMHKGYLAFGEKMTEELQALYDKFEESPTTPSQSIQPPIFSLDSFSLEAKEYFTNRMDTLEGRLNNDIKSTSALPSSDLINEFDSWKSQVEELGEKVNTTSSEVLSIQLKKGYYRSFLEFW